MTALDPLTDPVPAVPPVAASGPPDAGPSGPSARRWWALASIVTAHLIVFAGVTIMNVALPSAQADLGFGDATRQWVVTGYSLTFGGLILLGGRLSDVYGLRRGVGTGLVGFAAASLLGALAPNAALLVVARGLQGAAGALVASGTLALLSLTFPDGRERARAFGVLGTVMGLGTAGSFLVAGWFTDALSWRWCLAVNVPVALVAAAGLRATAPGDRPVGRRRVDTLGGVTVTAAIAALVVGFDRATVDGWSAWSTAAALVVGAGLLVAFVVVERRVSSPLLPLGVVLDRRRGAGYLAVFGLALGLFAGFFFMTFHLQDVLDYSALRTGFAFTPFGLAAFGGSLLITRAPAWAGPRVLLIGGLAATGVGVVLLGRLDVASGYATGVLPSLLLLGLGGTTVMVTASNLAVTGAGADSGVAGAAVGASQQIGAALGTALLSSIASAATTDYLRGHDGPGAALDARAHGLSAASTWGAALLAAAIVVTWVALPRRNEGPA